MCVIKSPARLRERALQLKRRAMNPFSKQLAEVVQQFTTA